MIKVAFDRRFFAVAALAATAVACATMHWWVPFVTDSGDELLNVPLGWFRAFGLVALGSTMLWSVAGLTTLYEKDIWQNAGVLGPGIFLVAGALVVASLASCVVGMWCLFHGHLYHHLMAVTLAEATFLFFDKVLLRQLKNLWNKGSVDIAKAEGRWSESWGRQLWAWFIYIDRPATIGFIALIIVVWCLDRGRVLYHFELEIFASGAVSLALMTANLAFFAANFPEFVPGKTVQ